MFENGQGKVEVNIATRLVEAEGYEDQFGSYGNAPFGVIEKEKLVLNTQHFHPSVEVLNQSRKQIFEPGIEFKEDVLFLKPYPGFNYDFINLDKKPKAVLHCLYHSSTACTEGEMYSLLTFIRRCREKGIDFYIASFKNKHAKMYATSREILNLGVVPLVNISPEAAYMKLLILYNQEKLTPSKIMGQSVYFESLPEK